MTLHTFSEILRSSCYFEFLKGYRANLDDGRKLSNGRKTRMIELLIKVRHNSTGSGSFITPSTIRRSLVDREQRSVAVLAFGDAMAVRQ